MLDVRSLRSDVSGIDDITHLNHCGSSLPPDGVLDAQISYLRAEQRMGGYEAAAAHADELADFYRTSAEMLGCDPGEIAFQPNAAEAWWRAFLSVPLQAGDRVLASRSEYQGNAFALMQAEARGVIVDVVPNDADGVFDVERLADEIDERVKLVSLTMISMSNGAVQPAAAVGAVCRDAGVPFLLDACQAAGQRPLDVDELGCDFLAYTGRKFMRGPRGTGVLYARAATIDQLGPSPFVDGRSAIWTDDRSWEHPPGAARFEWGERNYAGQIGLATATRYALDVGLDAIAERVTGLAEGLRRGLDTIPRVTVRDEGLDRCGIVTFTIDGREPADVQRMLADGGINVGCPGRTNAQWDIGRRDLDAVVRAGVHYVTTDAEIDRLLDALADI